MNRPESKLEAACKLGTPVPMGEKGIGVSPAFPAPFLVEKLSLVRQPGKEPEFRVSGRLTPSTVRFSHRVTPEEAAKIREYGERDPDKPNRVDSNWSAWMGR